MELIYCLSVAVLIVTARRFNQWSASVRSHPPPDSFRATNIVAIVQFLSFACAGFALGLLDGFLTLEFSGNQNAGIPLLIAVVPGIGVVFWGAIRGVRIMVVEPGHPEHQSCNPSEQDMSGKGLVNMGLDG